MHKFVLACLILCCACLALGQAGIAGSAHDFSDETWSHGQICLPCHTPHNANTTVAEAPLWNHELTAVATYTLYSTTSLDATVGQPNGTSRLCLSCHDGTVALENFGGVTNGTAFVTGTILVGNGANLSGDHPVSFTYDAALAATDGGLHDPTVTASGLIGGGTISDDMLSGGTMQSSSCHEVHNECGHNSLLILDNGGSALCLTCHDK
ncbi:MAG: cytochrome C [Acidobacteria bacterium]|nr:cytochrome C [Acidobacteriota bacterium]